MSETQYLLSSCDKIVKKKNYFLVVTSDGKREKIRADDARYSDLLTAYQTRVGDVYQSLMGNL